MDDINKVLNDYILTHNKNFGFCFINCEFVIEFDNTSIGSIETSYFIIQILLIYIKIYYMILIVLYQEVIVFILSIK